MAFIFIAQNDNDECKLPLGQKQLHNSNTTPCLCKHLQRQHANTKLDKSTE